MLCLSSLLPATQNRDNATYSIAVFGDTPYSPAEVARFPELVNSIEASSVDWAIHIGDIKAAATPCSDAILAERVQAIDSIKRPVVFVPGDNEWTDCHFQAVGGYAPLERLAFLRTQAYPNPGRSLGHPAMTVTSQAVVTSNKEFPEHQRWSQAGVIFTTLHVLGSANGLVAFENRTPENDAEVSRRVAAAVDWLNAGFNEAITTNAPALVVALHADMYDLSAEAEAAFSIRPFSPIIDALVSGATQFKGQVLLIHGDSHVFRFDRPIRNPETRTLVPNIFRLEVYGAPDMGWIEVGINPEAAQVFSIIPHPLAAR